ncbi:MAG: hypothetical protein ACTSUT_08075 [Promethearchaeota archaeon]
METEVEIRFTLNTPEEVEKLNIVMAFLKISKRSKLFRFLLDEKHQQIQKLYGSASSFFKKEGKIKGE